MDLVLLCLSVFVVSVAGVGIVRQLAMKSGWVVQPRSDRWHTKATALYGGVGFYPAFLLGSIITYFLYDGLALISQRPEIAAGLMQSVALGIGALLMFIFGWLDDLKQFRPVTKLLVQLIAASFAVVAGIVIPVTPVEIFNILITYFWFVGIINAVNMLDNMDGLSSGVIFIAVGAVVVLSVSGMASPSKLLAIPIALSLMMALLGFWFYNRPPASIFMGDSGSLFIGYVIASLAIPTELNGYFGIVNPKPTELSLLALLIPATLLAVPIFDTTLVTISRKWQAQKVSQGGRDHSSHRFVSLGFKEKQVIGIFYSLALCAGAIAVEMQRYIDYAFLLFSGFAIVLLLVGIYLTRLTTPEADNEVAPSTWTWRKIVSHFLEKWYVGMIMLDLVLIAACYYGAYLLRFDGVLLPQISESILNTVPLVVPACLIAFVISGIYTISWHFISVPDIARYVLGVVGGIILSLAVVVIVNRFEPGQSRGAYLIFGLLLFLVVVATRLSFRFFEHLLRISLKNAQNEQYQPILIYGAGKGGKILLEEILSNQDFKEFCVTGFIDDDLRKRGSRAYGLQVKSLTEWADYVKEVAPEIWISSKSISIDKLRNFENKLETTLSIRRLRLEIDKF
jgi:UDP-GlcNAc:undecaprenyl-phosphate GlcNAc-1-phosphate transferase